MKTIIILIYFIPVFYFIVRFGPNIIKEKFNGESAKLFFDTKKINKLLEEHKNGKRDSYKKVWTIYTFLVWYDIYFNEI